MANVPLAQSLTETQRAMVQAFAERVAELDPEGIRIEREADPVVEGRAAAELVLGDAGVWDEHLGGFYTVRTVRRLLGSGRRSVSRQAVSKRKGLLALTTGSGRVVYPRLQFMNGRPVAGLAEVLEILPESLVSRWTVASWLASENPELDGSRPIDELASGYTAVVVGAARRWRDALEK